MIRNKPNTFERTKWINSIFLIQIYLIQVVSEQLFLPPCIVFLFQRSENKSVSQYVFSD